jgi:hypothetical protein
MDGGVLRLQELDADGLIVSKALVTGEHELGIRGNSPRGGHSVEWPVEEAGIG